MTVSAESWRDFLARVASKHTVSDGMPWLKYRELQETFGFDLHSDVRALLEATNGVKDEFECDLIWPIERMIVENQRTRCDHRLRKQYMPLDCLFFIADAGDGDLFGYAVVDNAIQCSDIFVWNHEDDSRHVVATRLRDFIEGWILGTIKI